MPKIGYPGKFFLTVIVLFFCAQWVTGICPDQEKQVRAFIQTLAQQTFPVAARQSRKGYGLKQVTRAQGTPENSETILLVHGLDEPGIIWMNLIPALIQKRWKVYDMVYPNDQAVFLSADFFLSQLENLDDKGPVTIIAHSMGGLVARDMLTRTDLSYASLVQKTRVPRVKRLIMIGTPNHGSQLVRFRIVTEIRDQIHHWLYKDAHFFHFLLDGTGAAAVDLIPGSRFLRDLNQRPNPEGVDMHIIAGRVIPLDGKVWDWIGDVLVPVDSTRLKNIPHTLVQGTHLSMIRNLKSSSSRVPPAIPVIMNLLEATD